MKKILIFIFLIVSIVIGIIVYIDTKDTDNNSTYNEKKENHIPILQNSNIDTDKSDNFLMYIDNIIKEENYTHLKGTVAKGNININQEISISGLNKKGFETKIEQIKLENQDKESAQAGDNIDIIIQSNNMNEYIAIGQAVTIAGKMKPVYNIQAEINSVKSGNIKNLSEIANIFYINTDIKCSVQVVSEEKKEVSIKLEEPIVIDYGIEFDLKDENKVIARGKVLSN